MRKFNFIIILLLFTFIVSSCGNQSAGNADFTATVEKESNEMHKFVEIHFSTHVPANTSEDETVHLQLLDEITGLLLNSVTYEMSRVDTGMYVANIPVPINSIVKYRYTLGDSQTNIEFTPMGQPVRYRMMYAYQEMVVEDTVSTWTGEFTGNYGRVSGNVVDENGIPMGNSLVLIAGNQTVTSNDGSFLIDGVVIGKHHLVVYNPHGTHEVFQQEVVVGTDMETPVGINVVASKFVQVTFHLIVPEDSFSKLPIRLIGNQYQTGNVFTDLVGGISVPASRAPYLEYIGEEQHVIVLQLPVGCDFRYKYSHGDGFWSSEVSSDSRFPVRQLIIPDKDIDIYDTVESWNLNQKSPVSFIVEVPENFPENNSVSIQFRPHDWMTPIPMWQIDETHWFFPLTSPLNYFDGLNYRYCMNGDCDRSPEVNPEGLMVQRHVDIGDVPVNIEDHIVNWRWNDKKSDYGEAFTVTATEKPQEFFFGYEAEANAPVSVQPNIAQGIEVAAESNSNVIVYSPVWYFSRINLPNIEPVMGRTVNDSDLEQQIDWTSQSDMKTGLYPSTAYGRFEEFYWQYAAKDYGWWASWFDRYHRFTNHYAGVAQKMDVDFLVLGEPLLAESFEQFQSVADQGFSGDEFEEFLVLMVQDVRDDYSGQLFWSINYDGSEESLGVPDGIGELVDGYYILWNVQNESNAALTSEHFAPIFMEDLLKIKSLSDENHMILLAFNYPAITGAEKGGIYQGDTFESFEKVTDFSIYTLDEHTQTILYSIALNAIESQDWIDGFISRNYSLSSEAPDPSPSIRGKAVETLIELWFSAWAPPTR